MNADHFFRSAGCLIIGVCFTLVIVSILNQKWMSSSCDSINISAVQTHLAHVNVTNSSAAQMHSIFDTNKCHSVNYMPTFKSGVDLAQSLNGLELRVGAQIGGRDGNLTHLFLSNWKTVEEFVLVGEWALKANESASAARDSVLHHLQATNHLNKYSLCESSALSCSEKYHDSYFDWVFLDAHMDAKSTAAVLKAWWPKLKTKGVIAGHDYAPGAVDDFFSDKTGHMKGCARQITLSYRSPTASFWAVRK